MAAEKKRATKEAFDAGGGGFGLPGAAAGAVVVSHGLYSDSIPVAGKTVGEIRADQADAFDIPPDAQAIVNGKPSDDDTQVAAGDTLEFVKHAGEKGSKEFDAAIRYMAYPPEEILPRGTRAVIPFPARGGRAGLFVIHETVPRVHRVKWRTGGDNFGPGTKYGTFDISLPYIVTLAIFSRNSMSNRLVLDHDNEAFFRTERLSGLDGELCFPALLNLSRMTPGNPVTAQATNFAWICTQKVGFKARRGGETDYIQKGLARLGQHLLHAGFNLSSDHNEVESWYTSSVKAEIDPRIATVKKWAAATKKDPHFALEVPWLPAKGLTVAELIKRKRRRWESRYSPLHQEKAMERKAAKKG